MREKFSTQTREPVAGGSLLSEFPKLRKQYWGQHLWGRGYWVVSSGNVTDDMWKKYIDEQQPDEPDDNFRVV